MIALSPQQVRDRNKAVRVLRDRDGTWQRLYLQGLYEAEYVAAGLHHPVVRATRKATLLVDGSKALRVELARDGGQL